MENVTQEQFDELVKDGVTLIDFWAHWCGPCRMLAPILDKVQERLPNVKVVKLDVDQNKELSKNMKINSIPTMYVYKDGVEQNKMIGILKQADIELELSKALNV